MKAFIALVCLVISGAVVGQNSDERRCQEAQHQLNLLSAQAGTLGSFIRDAQRTEDQARALLGEINKAIADYPEGGQNYWQFVHKYWNTPDDCKRYFGDKWNDEYGFYYDDKLLQIAREMIVPNVQSCAAYTAKLQKEKALSDQQYEDQWKQFVALGCDKLAAGNSWPPGLPQTFGTPGPKQSPEESPYPIPSPAGAANLNEVTVPNFSVFDNVSEIKAVLNHAGLAGAFVVSAQQPPSKEKEFKFAGQDPAPDTKVAAATTVTISIYPKYGASVIVPDLSVFDSVSEMKAVLGHAYLTGAFVAAGEKPPSKDKEFKFAGQDPAPDTQVDPGTTVTVSIYQKFGEEAQGRVPNVVGLPLDQAQTNLAAAGLNVGGLTDIGKPPSADKANKIAGQDPAAGDNIPDNKLVSLKQYGSFKESTPSPGEESPPEGTVDFAGTWVCAAVDSRGPATYVIEHSGDGYSVAMRYNKGGSQQLKNVRIEGGQLIAETEKFDFAGAIGAGAGAGLSAGLGGSGNAGSSSGGSQADTSIILKFTPQGNGLLVESSLAQDGKAMPMERRPARRTQ